MNEQTYLVKIKMKGKSTFQMELFERTLLTVAELSKADISVRTVKIAGDSEEFVTGDELKREGPYSFTPCNSKGEPRL